MKKTIIALAIMATSTMVMADNGDYNSVYYKDGNLYQDVSKNNGNGNSEFEVISTEGVTNNYYGDVQGGISNVCQNNAATHGDVNQTCNATINNVNGDVTIESGANVTINKNTTVKEEVDITVTQFGDKGKEGSWTNINLDSDTILGIGEDGVVTITDAETGVTKINVGGSDGKDGQSAFQIAQGQGFEGTEEEWVKSLKGETGATGASGKDGRDGVNGADGKSVTISQEGASITIGVEGSEQTVTFTDTVRSDKEIKDLAAIGDKILDNKIDKVADVNTKRNNAQDKAIGTQWNMIKNVEAVNENQQIEIDQAHDRVDTLQQTVYEEGVIRAESDRILGESIESAREESRNADAHLQAQIDTKVSKDEFKADQARQDAETKRVEQESKDRDAQLAQSVTNVDNRVTTVVENQQKVDAAQDKVFNDYTVEQTKIDNNQYTMIEELYSQGEVRDQRIGALEQRMDKVEVEIAGIHNDNRRQDGMIAGVLAASTFEMPRDWNGEWAVQGAIGSYNGQEALAFGIVHAGEGYAIRATVTGTNADDFSEIGYGASVTISTSVFK